MRQPPVFPALLVGVLIAGVGVGVGDRHSGASGAHLEGWRMAANVHLPDIVDEHSSTAQHGVTLDKDPVPAAPSGSGSHHLATRQLVAGVGSGGGRREVRVAQV